MRGHESQYCKFEQVLSLESWFTNLEQKPHFCSGNNNVNSLSQDYTHTCMDDRITHSITTNHFTLKQVLFHTVDLCFLYALRILETVIPNQSSVH